MYLASRTRAQAIVIQGDRVLFGYHGKGSPHFFIGGGVEEGETAEQGVLRELREEANVEGTILLRLGDDVFARHVTFLVDIDPQTPQPGFDPEEHKSGEAKSLVSLDLVPLTEHESFTGIDIDYFKILLAECGRKNMSFPWLDAMDSLVRKGSQK